MNILIVDDERNIRLTLRDILEDEGYTIFLADSAEAGLKQLKNEEIDLAILDVKLPNMSGIEMFKKINTLDIDIDVLMISGHSGIETAVEAVKLGAYDFLEKPLYMDRILTAARNINEKRSLISRVKQGDKQLSDKYNLIGESPEMGQIKSIISRVAPTDSKVLIRGESGTGKELVAYAIHQQSSRVNAPFVRFNSAAIPNELVESELFGHEKGAFTGADERKAGKLELAHGGTLFLDEIGDMSLSAQAKVLRVIQEGTFERVGGHKTIEIDTRILAATHKNLEEMIKQGQFREDLFFRLNVIPITLPSLQNRTGDIPILANHFLKTFSIELKMIQKSFDAKALSKLESYTFPGNVRELRNLIERLCILTASEIIGDTDLSPHFIQTSGGESYSFLKSKALKDAKLEFEAYYISQQLKRYNWNISVVADKLGMHQPNLSRKIKELNIGKPD
ncbi:MAG: sigma-54-dependent Fis family transcriptional regulator [Candidatus Marinimicrobia bacterium]|nr:sigma-54-dependent Fis family transcriptional regulator [Candidatus Neomarinimicrobiota bacterium]